MPERTPKIVESTVEMPTRAIVGQVACPISEITVAFVSYERPRLKCASWTR